MEVPLVNLKRLYHSIKGEIDEAVERVLKSGQYILGEEVSSFEEEFSSYIGGKYGVGVGSGTDSLMLSLYALGIRKGDEVITPSFTFVATADVVMRLGATPVFIDSSEDYNINAKNIEKAINSNTKAIIVVHLFGYPANLDEILEISKKHNLILIEDCAQATGAKYNGERVGSFGKAGCFSFFPTKNLGAYGDGGMVVTDDKELYNMLRSLRAHGRENHNRFTRLGFKSRLDAIQAGILRVNLKHLDEWNLKRKQFAEIYRDKLSSFLKMPETSDNKKHSYYQFTVETEDTVERDSLLKFLNSKGIGASIYYPTPNHLQEVFSHLYTKAPSLPICERQTSRVLSLPIHPVLKEEEQQYVIDQIINFYS
jgi:hypothetical protein